MVVPYYDQAKVKVDIRETTTALDTQLDHWGDEAEAEINDRLWDKATKSRLISKLPTLPFASADVPESVRGSADNYVKMKFYEFTKVIELSNHFEKRWKEKIDNYVTRLNVNKEVYGRIAR